MKNPSSRFATVFICALALMVAPLIACSKDPPGATLELKLSAGPKNLSRSDITKFSSHEIEHGGKDYKGALLRDILGSIPPNATIRIKATDGYSQSLNAATAARDDCLLAYEKEGEPLSAPEGPLRLIIPNSPGLSVRAIASIEILP